MVAGRRIVRGVLALLLVGCASAPEVVPPVSAQASQALARARELRRRGAPPDDPGVWAAVDEARSLAPGWVAPERLADDLLRAELRGVAALEARRDAVAERPGDARAHYLVGRLEGAAGKEHFERALRLEPRLGWAHHGVAFEAARAGRPLLAARIQAGAVVRARDPWERAWFTLSRARWLLAGEREERGLELVRSALAYGELAPGDRAWLACRTARLELDSPHGETARTGFTRGLDLLRAIDLADDDLGGLVGAMLDGPRTAGERDRLELALAARPGALRERLRAELLLSGSSRALARALGADAEGVAAAPWRAPSRAQRFRLGEGAAAVEEWVSALPGQVLADDGLPRDGRLAEVAAAARAWTEAGGGGAHPDALRFAQALVEAGWYDEARELAEHLAAHVPSAALDLRERAVAGRVLLDALERILTGEEGGEADGPFPGAGGVVDPAAVAASPADLDGLLAALAGPFALAAEHLGGETDPARVAGELGASPRLDHGVLASVVHPGPSYSAADEGAGRGPHGAPVAGLAAAMDRLGRFALLGEFLGGGGPDATVLRRIAHSERRGEHLGVGWSGTVVWCDGVDVPGRAARAGARIAGAALHEGYWIDLAVVRADAASWERLAERFGDPADRAALDALLAAPAPRLRSEEGTAARSRERRAVGPLLGAAARLRLALMRERSGGGALAAPSLTELAEAVAVHEEGHLCDRTRFLPLGRNLGRILGIVLRAGLSPAAVQRRLERRAELVALCSVGEPRLILSDVLAAAEGGVDGPLPHGEAYRGLLADFLRELEERRARDPAAWSALDPQRALAHQLHLLTADQVRTVARVLAEREGLLVP
ncbi:MAG: hypothetical protein QF903_01385 [Planctomycetota bacterium]|jgi:hypothetical protein|nr:hypothetical protein [Planctomycetota bacterium]MDP6988115.1 hypothetical protein [Planctomycetota bacterium]